MSGSVGKEARQKIDEVLRDAEKRNQQIEALLRAENAPVAGSEARGRLVSEYLLNKGILAHARAAAETRNNAAEKEYREIIGQYADFDKHAAGKKDAMLDSLRQNAEKPDATEADKALSPDAVLENMKMHVHTDSFTPLEAVLTEDDGMDAVSAAYGNSVKRSDIYQDMMNAQGSDLMDAVFRAAFDFSFDGYKQEKEIPEDRARELSDGTSDYQYTKALLNQGLSEKYGEVQKLTELTDGLETHHRGWFSQDWADSTEMSDLKKKTRSLIDKTQETGEPREDDPEYGEKVWDVVQATLTYSNQKRLDNEDNKRTGPKTKMGKERLKTTNALNDHATSLVVAACLKNRGRVLSPEEREQAERSKVIGIDNCSKVLDKFRPGKIGGFLHKDTPEAIALREKVQNLQQAMKRAKVPVTSDPYVIEAMVEANEASTFYLQKKDFNRGSLQNMLDLHSDIGKDREDAARMIQELTKNMLIDGMKTEKARERKREQEREQERERERQNRKNREQESEKQWKAPEVVHRENEPEDEFQARKQAYKSMESSLKQLSDWMESSKKNRRGAETTKVLMANSAAKVVAIHNCMDEIIRNPQKWHEDLSHDTDNAFEHRVEKEANRLEQLDPGFKRMLMRNDPQAIRQLAAAQPDGQELPGSQLRDACQNDVQLNRQAPAKQEEPAAAEQKSLNEQLAYYRQLARDYTGETERRDMLKSVIVCSQLIQEKGGDALYDRIEYEAVRTDLANEPEFEPLITQIGIMSSAELIQNINHPDALCVMFGEEKKALAERRGPDYHNPLMHIDSDKTSFQYQQTLARELAPLYANDREKLGILALNVMASVKLISEGNLEYDEQLQQTERDALRADPVCQEMFRNMDDGQLLTAVKYPKEAYHEFVTAQQRAAMQAAPAKAEDAAEIEGNQPENAEKAAEKEGDQPEIQQPKLPAPDIVTYGSSITAVDQFVESQEVGPALMTTMLAEKIAFQTLREQYGDVQVNNEAYSDAFRDIMKNPVFLSETQAMRPDQLLAAIKDTGKLREQLQNNQPEMQQKPQPQVQPVQPKPKKEEREPGDSISDRIEQIKESTAVVMQDADADALRSSLAEIVALHRLVEKFGPEAKFDPDLTKSEMDTVWKNPVFQESIKENVPQMLFEKIDEPTALIEDMRKIEEVDIQPQEAEKQEAEIAEEPQVEAEPVEQPQEAEKQEAEIAEEPQVEAEPVEQKPEVEKQEAEIAEEPQVKEKPVEQRQEEEKPEAVKAEEPRVEEKSVEQRKGAEEPNVQKQEKQPEKSVPTINEMLVRTQNRAAQELQYADHEDLVESLREASVLTILAKERGGDKPYRFDEVFDMSEQLAENPTFKRAAQNMTKRELYQNIMNPETLLRSMAQNPPQNEQISVQEDNLESVASRQMNNALMALDDAFARTDNTRQRGSAANMKPELAQLLAVCTVRQEYERNPDRMGPLSEENFKRHIDRYSQHLQDPKNKSGKALDWMTKGMTADKAYETANARNKRKEADGSLLINAYTLANIATSSALEQGAKAKEKTMVRQQEKRK